MDCGPEYEWPEQVGQPSIEERYVDAVRRQLGDVPRRQRTALVAGVAADLAERPEAEAWEQLVAEMGEPADYARAVRAEHSLPPRVGIGAHLRATRWYTWVGIAAVVIAATVAIGYQRWSTADPGLTNNCSGAGAPDGGVTESGVAIEQREAAGAEEIVLSYRDGAEVSLFLCLTARPGVEVLDVAVPAPSLGMFKQDAVRATAALGGVDAESPVLEGPVPVPRQSLQVLIVGHLTDCEWYDPGGGMSFETADVTYRYRGRTATVPVDLRTQYTFLVRSADDCPRTRPKG